MVQADSCRGLRFVNLSPKRRKVHFVMFCPQVESLVDQLKGNCKIARCFPPRDYSFFHIL